MGSHHSCILTSSGDTWCWGGNWAGQLGSLPSATSACSSLCSFPCSTSPVRVEAPPFIQIVGRGATTCGLSTSGVHCWGAALGAPPECARPRGCPDQSETGACESQYRAAQYPELRGAVTITIGDGVLCGRFADGRWKCGGDIQRESMGICRNPGGALEGQNLVDLIGSDPGIDELALGPDFSCFRRGSDVQCLGRNHRGSIGLRGLHGPCVGAESAVQLPGRWKHVVVLENNTCLTSVDGAAFCIGDPQSGIPSLSLPSLVASSETEDPESESPLDELLRATPTPVMVASDIEALAGSRHWLCGRSTRGDVRCAENFGGPTCTPLARLLETGDAHACLVTFDNKIFCWGRNVSGACGLAMDSEVAVETLIAPPTNVLFPL
ncbi:MAG: hypothetical protein KC492_05415 [Myxococcales bacterium]|nr:hypothetical protein [Myxococcales bacterium]